MNEKYNKNFNYYGDRHRLYYGRTSILGESTFTHYSYPEFFRGPFLSLDEFFSLIETPKEIINYEIF